MRKYKSGAWKWFLFGLIIFGAISGVLLWVYFMSSVIAPLIISIVLFVPAIVFFVFMILNVLKNKEYKNILMNGKKGTGNFVSSKISYSYGQQLENDGVFDHALPMYYAGTLNQNSRDREREFFAVSFSFINDKNETVKIKTPAIYSEQEARGLEAKGSFSIKYIGNKAVID